MRGALAAEFLPRLRVRAGVLSIVVWYLRPGVGSGAGIRYRGVCHSALDSGVSLWWVHLLADWFRDGNVQRL